eukprot:51378_1
MTSKSYSLSDLLPYLSYNCPLDSTYLSFICRIILEYAPFVTDFELSWGSMVDTPSVHCDISIDGDLYSIHLNDKTSHTKQWAINILSEYKKTLLPTTTNIEKEQIEEVDDEINDPLRIDSMHTFEKLVAITNNKNKQNPNVICLASDCKILMYSNNDFYKLSKIVSCYEKKKNFGIIHGDAMPLLDCWKSNYNGSKLYALHGPRDYYKVLKPKVYGMGWSRTIPAVTELRKDKITKCCRLYSIFYTQLSTVTVKHIFDFTAMEISRNCSYYHSKQKCLFFVFQENDNNNIMFKIVKYNKQSFKLWNNNTKNTKKKKKKDLHTTGVLKKLEKQKKKTNAPQQAMHRKPNKK